VGERLAFGAGALREIPNRAGGRGTDEPHAPESAVLPPAAAERRPRDWAFTGLLTFTALLFFRPQDTFPFLRHIPLADIAALGALAAMVSSRLGRGLPVTRLTPELVGVLALGAVILGTAPFSVWPGGVIGTFIGLFAKVLLIFVLMVNTLTSPRRIETFAWLIVVASGYIAGRAVFDYLRGVNLIEYGRVQGSIGGIFKNPNDLALNMVALLPIAGLLLLQSTSWLRRGAAALCGVMMLGAIVASQSRSGTVGLVIMILVLAFYVVRRRPGIVAAAALAGVLVMPALPESYWHRIASITNKELDQTGSREARSILLRESWQAFLENPLTGVGAGQFAVYKPDERQEAWREAHNVLLQVAAELGIVGLLVFTFLIGRCVWAPMQMRRLVRQLTPGRRRRGAYPRPLAEAEREQLTMQAAALSASVLGWFACALFASVAYHWTFYYVLALATAPRDCLVARVAADRAVRSRAHADERRPPIGVPA